MTLTIAQHRALRALITLTENPVTKDQTIPASATTPGLVRAGCLQWVDEHAPGLGVIVTPLGFEMAAEAEGPEAEVPEGARRMVCFASSFAYEDAPMISHATLDGEKTLCGRKNWETEDVWDDNGPDCLRCAAALTRRETQHRKQGQS